MVNEIKKVDLTNEDGFPRGYDCASNVAITKGTLMKISADNTAAAADGIYDPIAGIALMGKDDDDYKTRISVWTDLTAEARCSGAIALGAPIGSAGVDNYILEVSGALASGAAVMGYTKEAGDDKEVINIRIRT